MASNDAIMKRRVINSTSPSTRLNGNSPTKLSSNRFDISKKKQTSSINTPFDPIYERTEESGSFLEQARPVNLD